MDSSCDGPLDAELIVLDSAEAVRWGFTSDRFYGHLRRRRNSVYIWLVLSKDPGKGNFSSLVQSILDDGYTIKIPTPIGRMNEIVRARGFVPTLEFDPEGEVFEVWVKEPALIFADS